MPIEIKNTKSVKKEDVKNKEISEFISEHQPINANVILQIFHRVSIRQLEKNGIIKYFDKDNQTGWVLANYSPQKYSKSFDPSTVEYLIREGNILLKHKKFQQSILRFEEVIKRDKKNIDALYGLGLIYIQYKTKTLKIVDSEKPVNPRFQETYSHMSTITREADVLFRVKKVVEYLDQILSINPKHRIALNEKKFIRVYQEFMQKKEKHKIKYNKIILDREKQGWNDPNGLHARMSSHPKLQKLRSEKYQLEDKILEWRENILKKHDIDEGNGLDSGYGGWQPPMDLIVPDVQISWALCRTLYTLSGSPTWVQKKWAASHPNLLRFKPDKVKRKMMIKKKQIRKKMEKKMELKRSEDEENIKKKLAELKAALKAASKTTKKTKKH